MKKRNYTHVQMLLPEIKAMLAEGKTQREVAEYYGFRDKQVVKRLLERERRKERKLEAGIRPRPKVNRAVFFFVVYSANVPVQPSSPASTMRTGRWQPASSPGQETRTRV